MRDRWKGCLVFFGVLLFGAAVAVAFDVPLLTVLLFFVGFVVVSCVLYTVLELLKGRALDDIWDL